MTPRQQPAGDGLQTEESLAGQPCPGHDVLSPPSPPHDLTDLADILNDPFSPAFRFLSPPASPSCPPEPCLRIPLGQNQGAALADEPSDAPLAGSHAADQLQPHPSPDHSRAAEALPLPPQSQDSTTATATASVQGLLDNPLNAALITAQLPKPHRTSPPQPAITKPRTRKKKLRPSDRLNALQAHLDTVVSQFKHLSLLNRHLHNKQRVLQYFAQDLDQYAALVAQVHADVAHHNAHPSDPPCGAAAYQQWTPQQFVSFHCAHVRDMTRLMLDIECASASTPAGPLPPAAAAALEQLVKAHRCMIHTTTFACHGRVAFIPQVMQLLGQAFPPHIQEELHWRNVLAAMELTEGQVEDLLVARELFLGFTDRMEREQQGAQAVMPQHPSQAAINTDMLNSTNHLEEQVLRRMAVVLRRHHGILLILTMFIFMRTLTPLQVGRCILHSHPLLPEPIVMMNVLHAQRVPATAAPALGPPPSPMRTAQTMSDLLTRGQAAFSHPQPPPRWHGMWAPT